MQPRGLYSIYLENRYTKTSDTDKRNKSFARAFFMSQSLSEPGFLQDFRDYQDYYITK